MRNTKSITVHNQMYILNELEDVTLHITSPETTIHTYAQNQIQTIHFLVEKENARVRIVLSGSVSTHDDTHITHHIHANARNITCVIQGNIVQFGGTLSYTSHISDENFAIHADQKIRILERGNQQKNIVKPCVSVTQSDSKISHAISIETINPDKIFYLESLGIARTDAEHILETQFTHIHA